MPPLMIHGMIVHSERYPDFHEGYATPWERPIIKRSLQSRSGVPQLPRTPPIVGRVSRKSKFGDVPPLPRLSCGNVGCDRTAPLRPPPVKQRLPLPAGGERVSIAGGMPVAMSFTWPKVDFLASSTPSPGSSAQGRFRSNGLVRSQSTPPVTGYTSQSSPGDPPRSAIDKRFRQRGHTPRWSPMSRGRIPGGTVGGAGRFEEDPWEREDVLQLEQECAHLGRQHTPGFSQPRPMVGPGPGMCM